MWQVNGFDRRCFQLGRGFHIYGPPLPDELSQCYQPEASKEGCALLGRAEQLLLEADPEALKAAEEALAALSAVPRAAAARLAAKARILARGAELQRAEDLVEAEAAGFHEAGCTVGVVLMRLTLAELDLERGTLCRCKSAAEMAAEALKELPPEDKHALVARLVYARALAACGDRAAQAEAAAALEKCQRLGDRRKEAYALHVLALATALGGTRSAYEEGLRHATDAQNLYSDLQLWHCHASVELSLARLCLESEQPRKAMKIAEEALTLLQELGSEEHPALGLFCQAALDLGVPEHAESAAQLAVQRAQTARQHALALELLAGVLSESGQDAAPALGRALDLSKEDPDLEARLLLRLSSLEANEDEALKALEQAIGLWSKLPEKAEAIACARYLSVGVLLRNFDPKESLREASEARRFFAEEGDAFREGLALLAAAASLQGFEESKETAEFAAQLFQKASEPRGEAMALSAIAEMHRSRGEDDLALEAAQRCRLIVQEAGWKEEEVKCLVDIANLQRQVDVKTSARTAREGLRMAKRAGQLEDQVRLLMQCVQCNLLLANSGHASRNLLEETLRYAATAMELTRGDSPWRRRLRGLAIYWQAHAVALKDSEASLKLLDELEKECVATKNEGLRAHGDLLAAQILLSSDKPKALELLRSALATLKRLGDTGGSKMAEEVLERATAVPAARPALEGPTEEAAAAPAAPAPKKMDPEAVRAQIRKMAGDAVMQDEVIENDSVLMDAGMDSLTSVSFRNELAVQFQLNLPASLIFDYPSVGELTKFIVDAASS